MFGGPVAGHSHLACMNGKCRTRTPSVEACCGCTCFFTETFFGTYVVAFTLAGMEVGSSGPMVKSVTPSENLACPLQIRGDSLADRHYFADTPLSITHRALEDGRTGIRAGATIHISTLVHSA